MGKGKIMTNNIIRIQFRSKDNWGVDILCVNWVEFKDGCKEQSIYRGRVAGLSGKIVLHFSCAILIIFYFWQLYITNMTNTLLSLIGFNLFHEERSLTVSFNCQVVC